MVVILPREVTLPRVAILLRVATLLKVATLRLVVIHRRAVTLRVDIRRLAIILLAVTHPSPDSFNLLLQVTMGATKIPRLPKTSRSMIKASEGDLYGKFI